MKLKHLILFIFLFNYVDVLAQTDSSTLYTNTKDGYTHFYYDEQYYLVDKDCKFRHYTRVLKKVKKGNLIDGFFTDYYNNDRIALTGNYINGEKSGPFKNYYFNGKLKSEIPFLNNKPSGVAKYYYDNGTPWMIIHHRESKVFITDYWDPFGNKKVTEGKGSFEYQDWAWGFNDTGFNSITYKGRLRDGLPNGSWSIFANYPNSPSELLSIENFQKGVFVDSYNFNNLSYPKKASNLKFYPSFEDNNSQKFISKNCRIDDNQNYTTYLENFLNRNFDFKLITNQPTITPFIFEVSINERGRANAINIKQGDNERIDNYIKALFGIVPYWIPSFINGKTISDKLTITFSLDNTKPEKRFENLKISRQEENQN